MGNSDVYIPKDSEISIENAIQPIVTFKLFVEGEKSESNYFRALEDFIGCEFIEIISIPRERGARNSQLIKNAKDAYDAELLCVGDADSETISNDLSQIWILFDIEGENCSKSKNDKALIFLSQVTSKIPQIKAALSNPCFEYWVLLHLIDDDNKNKYIYNPKGELFDYKNNKEVVSVFKKFPGTPFHNYKKDFDFVSAKIFEEGKLKKALTIAKEIKSFYRIKKSISENLPKEELYKLRPFTDVDELINQICLVSVQPRPYIQFKEKSKKT